MLMFRFFYGIIQSNMENKIRMDATLTFDLDGHLQGHKVLIVFNMIWRPIAGDNEQVYRIT